MNTKTRKGSDAFSVTFGRFSAEALGLPAMVVAVGIIVIVITVVLTKYA